MLRRTIGISLSLCFLLMPFSASATPAILDTLNITPTALTTPGLSLSFTYTVPSGGTNTVEVVQIHASATLPSLTVTQNGTSMSSSCQQAPGPVNQAFTYVCWLAAPTTGTLALSWSTNSADINVEVLTLNNAKQTAQPDAPLGHNTKSVAGTVNVVATTTPVTSGDLLIDIVSLSTSPTLTNHGGGQTEYVKTTTSNWQQGGSFEATTTTSTGTMSEVYNAAGASNYDMVVSAWAPAPAAAAPKAPPPGLIQFQ